MVGGGVAGLSAACALAEAGLKVQVIERRSYLGGRASSFHHPGADEDIDNCQHVLFGCCTNLIGFYERIGVTDKIHWTEEMTMIEPGGRQSKLGPSPLPAPMHSLPRFLTSSAFTWRDKLALARAFQAMLQPIPTYSAETLATWLARHGQTKGAIERFWRLVITSALNADLDAIAVPYAAKVIRELFMASAQAGRMGMSRVPLSQLYANAVEYLSERGGSFVYNARVEGATWDERTARWTLVTTAGPIEAESLVLALPFEATAKLLPRLPAAAGADRLAEQLTRHESWPICSVHLWYDREITSLDHAVLLDRGIHWMYNKSRLQPGRTAGGSYLELVASASRKFAALPGEQAIAQATAELAEFFPGVRSATLKKSVFIKEVRATFGVPPGIDAARPGAESPWKQCFLAGDWTNTGWPSTMESAARSGHLAAEAVCRSLGQPRVILNPDLKARGLMRLIGPKSG